MSSKRPSDTFTRFTSNTPTSFSSSSSPSNAAAAPSFTASGPQPNSQPSQFPPGPANETPQERVARLRALNQQRRLAEFTTQDRIIARGRKVADYAHRYTAYSLLLFSGVAGIFAVYGFFSLASHHRVQKRAWIEREMDRLDEARKAFLEGRADAEQLHLLEQERAGEIIKQKYEQDQKKKKEDGILGKFKGLFASQTGQGDRGVDDIKVRNSERLLEETSLDTPIQSNRSTPADTRGIKTVRMGDTDIQFRPAAVQDSAVKGVGLDEKDRPVPIDKMQRIPITAEPRVVEAVRQQRGGPMDMLAENIVQDTKKTGQSWWSWATGSKS